MEFCDSLWCHVVSCSETHIEDDYDEAKPDPF